jgi:hypothetical protein
MKSSVKTVFGSRKARDLEYTEGCDEVEGLKTKSKRITLIEETALESKSFGEEVEELCKLESPTLHSDRRIDGDVDHELDWKSIRQYPLQHHFQRFVPFHSVLCILFSLGLEQNVVERN